MFWRGLLTQHAYYSTTCTLPTRSCKMCHCNEHCVAVSALKVRVPEQMTALSAKTEQFITAKIFGTALKQWNTLSAMPA